jgi:hypothetical protein
VPRKKKKKSKKKKFGTVPSRLTRIRYGAPYRGDLRVYGLVETETGKRKRISFQVKVGSALMKNKQKLMQLIRATVNSIKYQKMIPVHRQGDVFSSFKELFDRTKWVRIRRLLDYKAGMHYER